MKRVVDVKVQVLSVRLGCMKKKGWEDEEEETVTELQPRAHTFLPASGNDGPTSQLTGKQVKHEDVKVQSLSVSNMLALPLAKYVSFLRLPN